MVPLMSKDAVRYITLNITPEEAEYVAGIKSTLDDAKATDETSDDIIYLTKLIAFYTKFKNLTMGISDIDNASYKMNIQDFCWRLELYKEEISENIQSIIGEIKGSAITKLELPISDNPLELINEVKQCVLNWFVLHKDDIEYEGARSLTGIFLSVVHKYVYVFRLCKISAADYEEKCCNCKCAEMNQYDEPKMILNPNIKTEDTLGTIGLPY